MVAALRPVTSIVRAGGAANALSAATVTKAVVPQREEIITADAMKTPEGIQKAFMAVQRHGAEATQSARSLPVQGGTYWPDVVLHANTAHVFQHGIANGVAVSWLVGSVRPAAANALAVSPVTVVEVAQDAPHGRITLASNASGLYDVWFFPKPQPSPQ